MKLNIRVRPSLEDRVKAARDMGMAMLGYSSAEDYFGEELVTELVKRGILLNGDWGYFLLNWGDAPLPTSDDEEDAGP